MSDSPWFPRSPWFSVPGNAPTELDLRTPPVVTAVETPPMVPKTIHLAPARPNPFRSSTRLSFVTGKLGHGRITIYDVTGRQVVVLADRRFEPGRHLLTWNGGGTNGAKVADGICFARLTFDGSASTRSLVLVH